MVICLKRGVNDLPMVHSLLVGLSNIQRSSFVRDLGIFLDSELTVKQRVTKISATCLYHIRRQCQVCRRVGQEVTLKLVVALVMF